MRAGTPMPSPVRIAILGLAIAMAVQVGLVAAFGLARQVGWLKGLFAVGLFALLLAGLARRSRLAWLWSRSLGYLLAAGAVLGLLLQVRAGGLAILPAAVLVLGVAVPLAAHSLALGRRTALAWFGLVCPACGASTSRGDLLMRTAQCRKCGELF